MEMAINLAKFYIGQIKLVHSFSDEEGLAPGIVKLFELSKRLDTNGKNGWIKAQQYRELFAAKKRPSAQQARSLMLEAESMGVGRTRGTGNRLEYHWLRDNNGDDNLPTYPDNLGNLGKLREDLGNNIPYAEPPIHQRLQDNLGNLGKGIPNSSTTSLCGYIPHKTEEEIYEEGGYVPEPSLSTTQISSDKEPVGVTDLGNNLGNPFPNPSLSSLNEKSHEVVALAVNSTVKLAESEAPGSAKLLEEQPTPVEQEDSHQNSHHPTVGNPTDDYSTADLPNDSEIVITCPALGEGGGGENSTRVTVDSVTVVEKARDLSSCEDADTPTYVEQTASTSADESEKAIAFQVQRTWAWSNVTGESLGEVLSINRIKGAKIRRSGELPRYAKFYPLQEITFDNPVVQALSLNTAQVANTQWEHSEQFLEELDD